jgi:phage tail tape-measure protein
LEEKYFEFLGNFFLSAAKAQKQMDDIMAMSKHGFKGFEEMSSMFRSFYGLDKMEKNAPEYMKTWENASEEFQKSFKEYLNILGVVPKEDYIALVKRYEDLKVRVRDQEETIRHLQMLLGEKGSDQGESVKVFQDLMKKQSEQFVEMMDSVGEYFKKNDRKKEEKKDDGED